MKLVLQRVKTATVCANDEIIGSIGIGLVVLFGVHRKDTPEKTPWFVNKLLSLRIFEDEAGKMNKNIKEVDGEILIVSQFTLYADCLRGRRPDFMEAAPSQIAKPIYQKFVEEVKKEMENVATGKFGALMQISLINDGPLTLILERVHEV